MRFTEKSQRDTEKRLFSGREKNRERDFHELDEFYELHELKKRLLRLEIKSEKELFLRNTQKARNRARDIFPQITQI